MYSKFRLTLTALIIGFGTYFLYAAIIVPTLVLPRAARRRITARPPADTSSEVEQMSRENSELLAAVFPDPNDWRRAHPLSVIPKDRSWLLLFPSEPHPHDGTLTFDSCTIVIPNADRQFSETERFRRAIVVETNDKVEFRFKGALNLQTLSGGFSPADLESGRIYGKVTVWSKMDPDTLADDFHLTTRNIAFNLEQITTDSEVIARYGNRQAEGTGLRVSVDLPLKKKEEAAPAEGEPLSAGESDPLAEEFSDGNLAFGFSIRDVSLDKLNRLEFDIPDYLPTIPEMNPWEKPAQENEAAGESAAVAPPDEETPDEETPQTVTVDVRCSDKVYFAPNVTDAPSVWCARFSGDVEITAFHEERQADSLRCDYLYFYLNDPVLKEKWDQYGSAYKGKPKPTGKLTRLVPYQVRAIGSPERRAQLRANSELFTAEGGEILCEIDRRRIAVQPLPDPLSGDETEEKGGREEEVALRYGRASVVSNRIEFVYDPDSFGELRAYKKGRLETDLPGETAEAEAEHLTVTWNELVQIAPVSDEPDLYAASFRGGVRAESGKYGTLTARQADLWFKTRPKGESDPAAGAMPAVSPQSARLSGDVEMTTARGTCRIRDDMEILFDREENAAASAESPPAAAAGPKTAEKNPFGAGGSLMGEEGGAAYSLTAGRLKLWALLRSGGGVDISHIVMRDQFVFTETDPADRQEVLHIDGTDVRIENPSSEKVSVTLRGRPANFVGNGLNLTGYDIRVNRPENMFSVIGSGRLRFIIPKTAGAGPDAAAAAADEPVEVWWPSGMTFDGRSLVFQGKVQPAGVSPMVRPKENELVNVRQGQGLELKSPLISLTLKQPIQIFDFEMGEDASGASKFQLDKTTCQGTPAAPVSVSWFGTVPGRGSTGEGRPLRGRGSGEAAFVTVHAESGDFTASGPGWLRGTVETPEEGFQTPSAPQTSAENGMLTSSKPWTHFHLVFHDSVTGNIRSQTAKIGGDVRLVMAGSEESRLNLNVNEHSSFPPEAFFLTCEQLGAAGVASPGDQTRNLELTATGDTRFDFQTFTGRGEVLKYDHRKRTVMLQGSGVTPAALSQQERPGAPVNTQTFSSASFNLETKNIDLNLSGTGFSPVN